MLSDSPEAAKKYHVKKRRGVKDTRKWYSDSQKIDAAKLWLVLGNLNQTAGTLDIPVQTMKEWRYSKWWDEICRELKAENRLQLSNKLKTLAAKALQVTEDRLDNGDFFVNRVTGEIDRKPVLMRDAYLVAAGVLDRHIKIEEKPNEEVARQVNDRLEVLARTFASFSKKVRVIEIEDAVQIKETGSVDVCEQTTDGEEVGGRDEEEGKFHSKETENVIMLENTSGN